MKNGDMPAMPLLSGNGALWNLCDGHEDSDYLGQKSDKFSIGMTKREQFAMAAMQGMLSNSSMSYDFDGMAHDALVYADALLAELERTK